MTIPSIADVRRRLSELIFEGYEGPFQHQDDQSLCECGMCNALTVLAAVVPLLEAAREANINMEDRGFLRDGQDWLLDALLAAPPEGKP